MVGDLSSKSKIATVSTAGLNRPSHVPSPDITVTSRGRKANELGGVDKPFDKIAMLTRNQLGDGSGLDTPEGEPEFLDASNFKYMVPRWRCMACKAYLMADVSICPDIPGPKRYNLAMAPAERIEPKCTKEAEYHM